MSQPASPTQQPANGHPQVAIRGKGTLLSAVPLLSILVLAGMARLVALDRLPPGINQDEAIHAYEAWCLRTTGGDHWGRACPAFFRCFGRHEHHSAPFIWLQVPLQTILGMNVWSARLPSAILGTCGVWWLYLLMKRWYTRRIGLLAALLLAVSPWHVHLSRLAFEVSICPSLIVLAMLLLTIALTDTTGRLRTVPRPGDLLSIFVAGLILGITWWTYNAMRVFIPLLLLGGGWLFLSRVIDAARRRYGLLAGFLFMGAFLIGGAPFIWACIHPSEQAWGRASAMLVFNRTADLPGALRVMASVYAMHFSPSFLFISGDPSAIQSVPGYGQLHLVCAPLLAIGLYRVMSRWGKERPGRLILWWLLAAAVPPALTVLHSGHSLRAAGSLPAWQMLSALGLDLLLSLAAARSRATFRGVAAVAAVIIALNAAWFAWRFATYYRVGAAVSFQAEWRELAAFVEPRKNDYDAILLTNRETIQPGMLYLFWSRTPPAVYFATDKEWEAGAGLDTLWRFGRIHFRPSSYLTSLAEKLPAGAKVLVAERPGVFVPGQRVVEIRRADGTPALVLYDVFP